MGEFEGDDALFFEDDAESSDKIVEVGHVRKDVIAEKNVGLAVLGGELVGCLCAEEFDEGGDPFIDGYICHIASRFDAEDGDLMLFKVLEEIAVVAGDFDHLVLTRELETGAHHLNIFAGVLEPRGRVRGEVGVVGEDSFRFFHFFELNEEAFVTDVGVQIENGLLFVELFLR